MKNSKIRWIPSIFIIITGILLGYYISALKDTENILREDLKGKDKIIANLREKTCSSPTNMKFREAENKIIEIIKDSEVYKKDLEYVEPYAYLKFNNTETLVDSSWAYGKMNYANKYKDTDSWVYDGRPLTTILNSLAYIIKFYPNGEIQTLVVEKASDDEEWNKALYELPETILSRGGKYYRD